MTSSSWIPIFLYSCAPKYLVLYCAEVYCTILYCTILYCTVLPVGITVWFCGCLQDGSSAGRLPLEKGQSLSYVVKKVTHLLFFIKSSVELLLGLIDSISFHQYLFLSTYLIFSSLLSSNVDIISYLGTACTITHTRVTLDQRESYS